MQQEDRPIHFSTELLFPAFPLKPQAIQRLYYELSQTETAAYDSVDLSRKGPPRFVSKRPPKAQSLALLLPDRVVVLEEWVDFPFAAFLDKARTVAAKVLETFELEAFTAQTATVRTTFALSFHDDARRFVLEQMCGQEGRIGPHFRRPILAGGLRFTLPAAENAPGDLQVLVESFRHARDEVFVEVRGAYRDQRITGDCEEAATNLQRVRDFIVDSVRPFIEQYDQPAGLS
jgi:hypothetical protein